MGWTPTFLAVRYNSHECLQSLLRAGASCTIVPNEGNLILHYAAAYADEKTMELLTSSEISRVDLDLESYIWSDFPRGVTASELFWKRRKALEETRPPHGLIKCMEDLLEKAKGRKREKRTRPHKSR